MVLKRDARLRVHLIGSDSVAYYRMDGSDEQDPEDRSPERAGRMMLGVVSEHRSRQRDEGLLP